MDATAERDGQHESLKSLEELVCRAQRGDAAVLPELRQTLDADPTIWQAYGDLAAQAQAAWLSLLAGKDLLLAEAVRRKQEELRAELAGPEPSPLEKLLVERIVACHLQSLYADALYAQARQASPATLRELMRRQESAQKRYLSSIKQLALVRKLLRPSLSPLDLATRTVPEGLAGIRTAAGTRKGGRRLATVN